MTSKSKGKPKGRKTRKTVTRNQLGKWSAAVRERDGHRCQVCGSERNVQAHHLLPRRFRCYAKWRLDPRNGISLCARCHSFGARSAESGSVWFGEWLRTNRPEIYLWLLERI